MTFQARWIAYNLLKSDSAIGILFESEGELVHFSDICLDGTLDHHRACRSLGYCSSFGGFDQYKAK